MSRWRKPLKDFVKKKCKGILTIPKQGFKWLNENGTIYDFKSTDDLLTRLTASITPTKEISALFNSKHAHIFVAAFKAFTESGKADTEYARFLEWFANGGCETDIDGKSWNILDADRATRDSTVVHGKLDYLVALMKQYFDGIKKVA